MEQHQLKHTSDFIYSDPEFSWEITVAPTGISFVDEKWDSFLHFGTKAGMPAEA